MRCCGCGRSNTREEEREGARRARCALLCSDTYVHRCSVEEGLPAPPTLTAPAGAPTSRPTSRPPARPPVHSSSSPAGLSATRLNWMLPVSSMTLLTTCTASSRRPLSDSGPWLTGELRRPSSSMRKPLCATKVTKWRSVESSRAGACDRLSGGGGEGGRRGEGRRSQEGDWERGADERKARRTHSRLARVGRLGVHALEVVVMHEELRALERGLRASCGSVTWRAQGEGCRKRGKGRTLSLQRSKSSVRGPSSAHAHSAVRQAICANKHVPAPWPAAGEARRTH